MQADYECGADVPGRKSGAEMARPYGVSEPAVSRIVAAYRTAASVAKAGGVERICGGADVVTADLDRPNGQTTPTKDPATTRAGLASLELYDKRGICCYAGIPAPTYVPLSMFLSALLARESAYP